MITGKFFTDDDEFVIIQDSNDLADLIERRIGYEAGMMIRELAELATREAAIADTDIKSMEEELSELHMALREIDDEAQKLLIVAEKERLSKADKQLIRSIARKIYALV